jgi:hypothetical protein
MITKLLPAVALLACVAAIRPSEPASPVLAPADTKITGDYVEARTASVFAGPCHYNGELVTTGRDAVMAWSFSNGTFHGTNLSGVRVMAAVTSPENLGDTTAAKRSELIIDPSASDAQVAAVSALLKEKIGAELGMVEKISRAPVSFTHNSDGYTVQGTGFAAMSVQPMPDDSCCVQANLVWYEPLSPLDHRKVGFTDAASYHGTIADRWERHGENSAFYGSFTF